jgi:oxygen-independent coproporphyrinogen-3 oxidase
MAGLYIHIPFCRQKCHYCNFFSLASRKNQQQIIVSLLQEMELQKSFADGEALKTIYFGGGTPSLFQPEIIEKLIEKANSVFGIENNAEITLEANPDDINHSWLSELRKTRVNRLSIGIQSFFDEDLVYLHRAHNAAEATKAVKSAQEFGFQNLSIDLIYGIPTLDDERWNENINNALALEVPHISAYALTVEPGTALDLFIRKGKYQNVDDEKAARQFTILMDRLTESKFIHYEISNFCTEGNYSRHNTSYWSGEKYLGIGPSAHSYDGISRQWNVSNISEYIKSINAGIIPSEKEILTKIQKFNEYIMTSLRTIWGTDLEKIEAIFGKEFHDYTVNEIQPAIAKELAFIADNKIRLTSAGKFFADRIASEMFITD